MTPQIFGREEEIEILERLYSSPRPEFLAVYGRRRVGKTYLIQEFFRDKEAYFSFTGTLNSPKREQLKKFYRSLQIYFKIPKSVKVPKDWDEAFFVLKEEVRKIDPKKRVVLFFDELPWFASKNSGFLRALDYVWNQYFSNMNNIFLIICGSAANWIIKKVIQDKGGLYGRLSQAIKLQPFSLKETENFLKSFNIRMPRVQITELYVCLGGIAKYLTYLEPNRSTAELINKLCFTMQGQLVEEFDTLYHSLFDDSYKHLAIIKALAEKKQGLSEEELLNILEFPSGGRSSQVLEELESCAFIATSPSFQKKTKNKRFWLTDEFSLFYLNWMEPIRGSILRGHDEDYWLRIQNDPSFRAWSGYAFESVCFKHIAQIKKALGIAAVLTDISQWSYRPKTKEEKGAQIDLVIDRRDGCVNLCEIKFSDKPFVIDKAYAEQLRHKVSLFREHMKTPKALFLTFITPFGVQKNEYSIELVHRELTLDDLFS